MLNSGSTFNQYYQTPHYESTPIVDCPDILKNYADRLFKNGKQHAKNLFSANTLEEYKIGTKLMGDFTMILYPETIIRTDGVLEESYGVTTLNNPMKIKLNSTHAKELQSSGEVAIFGWDLAQSSRQNTICIAKNPLDAMSIYQATEIPSLCFTQYSKTLIPMTYEQLLKDLFKRYKNIYFWNDPNTFSDVNLKKWSRILGFSKCKTIEINSTPFELFQQGETLKDHLSMARPLLHDNILNASTLRNSIYDQIKNYKKYEGVQSLQFPSFNKYLKGLRTGELTIFSGPTGSGKTTILSQFSLDFAYQKYPVLWGSFEIKYERLIRIMLQQVCGNSLIGVNETDFNQIFEKFSQLPLYFLNFHGSTSCDEVISSIESAIDAYQIRLIVLDNLQFMLSGQETSSLDKFSLFDAVIQRLRDLATRTNIHLVLVVHPRKEDDYTWLGLSSITGTAKATQEADNVIVIQKTKEGKRYLDYKKNRWSGTLGKVEFTFDKEKCSVQEVPPETEDEEN